ncbi:GbsR/MarR family transcriptional regulator [Zobellia uliginosa]|uniref:GbsR/MarR family transcriptional regulator n=1 Tax=Zobellia uliginosa TaxID=143224 RepID=UPI0026E3FF44|nr:transcriptional regulator [Zobellia uliginosa]MDO6515965.1 transcriptional regulator [Zobellia uliginosa]
MDKEECKQILIEELGVHFEFEYSLPPLAARIFANLVVTEEEGLTFDDCLTKRGASKSSISTSLNLLQQTGFINYFTKSGDRKRYFKVAEKDAFFIKKLNQTLKKIESESLMIEKVAEYNKVHNPQKHEENKEKKRIYMKCLEDTREIYRKTIADLKNLKQ